MGLGTQLNPTNLSVVHAKVKAQSLTARLANAAGGLENERRHRNPQPPRRAIPRRGRRPLQRTVLHGLSQACRLYGGQQGQDWAEVALCGVCYGEGGKMTNERKVAALYVEPNGCYVDFPAVEPWDEARDARTYAGPHPVVAHPPCQRWGRFWHGSTRKPHQYQLGADNGCFEAALVSVKRWGGVLEHPAHSKAFDHFALRRPEAGAGWQWDMLHDVWVCHVEQGHYGHSSRKGTWLIAAGVAFRDLPDLKWTKGEQRLPDWMIERYGYEKARRIGVVAMVGGKNKTAIRNATPLPFRDVLLSIARSAAA